MAVMDRASGRQRSGRKKERRKRRAGYDVEAYDWPTWVPSPDVPLHRSARVLNQFDELMPQAMEELRALKVEQHGEEPLTDESRP